MRTLLILALIVTALPNHQQIQKQKQTLVDFRLLRSIPPPKIAAAAQRAVLSKLFRKFLTDDSKCNQEFEPDGNDPLKAARIAGQIVPSIEAMATGSFTAAGQTQTAYVIFVRECNASHADSYGTKRVAIFSGQQLIADVDSDFKSDIALKTDLNSDGLDELLLTSGDLNQGTVIEMAALVSFQNGRMRVLHDFGTVVEDSCASELPGSNAKASVISISDVVPGEMPKLRQDNYVSGCRGAKRWRFLSTGRMP